MAMETKSIFASTTFWMVLFNIALKLLSLFIAIDVEDEQVKVAIDNLSAAMPLFVSFLFDAGAIYGRIKASTKIGRPKN
jgi:hypothetical protein